MCPIASSSFTEDPQILHPGLPSYRRNLLTQVRAVVLTGTAVRSMVAVFNKVVLHLVDACLLAPRPRPPMDRLVAILVLSVSLKRIGDRSK